MVWPLVWPGDDGSAGEVVVPRRPMAGWKQRPTFQQDARWKGEKQPRNEEIPATNKQ
jgi:hypothetical protein